MSEFKFAPEFVSVDELLVLVKHYQKQIEQLKDQMWFVGNGKSTHETDNEEHRELLAKKKLLLKRKYYIQRCIKHRNEKDADKKIQPRTDSERVQRTGINR